MVTPLKTRCKVLIPGNRPRRVFLTFGGPQAHGYSLEDAGILWGSQSWLRGFQPADFTNKPPKRRLQAELPAHEASSSPLFAAGPMVTPLEALARERLIAAFRAASVATGDFSCVFTTFVGPQVTPLRSSRNRQWER